MAAHDSASAPLGDDEDPLDAFMRELADGGAVAQQADATLHEPALHAVEWRPHVAARVPARSVLPLLSHEAPSVLLRVCTELASTVSNAGMPVLPENVLTLLLTAPQSVITSFAAAASDAQLQLLQAAIMRTHPKAAPALHAAISAYGSVRRNRRYRALQRMLRGSSHAVEARYFSDAAMRERDSPLFKSMLGDVEAAEQEVDEDMPGTSVHDIAASAAALYQSPHGSLLSAGVNTAELLRMRTAADEATRADIRDARVRAVEQASTGLSRMLLSAMDKAGRPDVDGDDEEEVATDASSAAVHMADERTSATQRRKELIQIMAERFLDGRDAAFFDYARVDTDESLDVSAQSAADAEEQYFGDMDEVVSGSST